MDDDRDLLEPVFRIEDEGEEFNLDLPPTTGNEYLRRVQLEAQNCPGVVVADIEFQTPADKITMPSSLLVAPRGYAPSVKWQKTHAANFSEVRQGFARYRSRLKKASIDVGANPKVPIREDMEGWCRLCFGSVQPRHGKSPGGTCVGGSPPTLRMLTQIDQPTVVTVLEYHINWLEATGFTHHQGCWFYVLLVCLEKPLCPEACSLLRTLARLCSHIRASLESTDDALLAPLNLLICLVSRYFGQMDLADNG